jgi:hypothetical protein
MKRSLIALRLIALLTLVMGTAALSACGAATAGNASPSGVDVTVISTELGEYRIERPRQADGHSARVSASPADVFSVLPSVYRDLGIPLGTVDTNRFILGNTDHRASRRIAGVRMSRFFRCGRSAGFGAELADAGPVRISIISRVDGDGADGARIRTEASAEARSTDGTSTARSACASTGLLEALVVAMAEDRLGSR